MGLASWLNYIYILYPQRLTAEAVKYFIWMSNSNVSLNCAHPFLTHRAHRQALFVLISCVCAAGEGGLLVTVHMYVLENVCVENYLQKAFNMKHFLVFSHRQVTSWFACAAKSQLTDFQSGTMALTCAPMSRTAFGWTPAVKGKMGAWLVPCTCRTLRKACGCWPWACSATTPLTGGMHDAEMDEGSLQVGFEKQASWVLFVHFSLILPCHHSDTRMLKIQQHRCKTHGFCTFSCFGPHIWNSLPQDLHCWTLSSFKDKLKTFVFSQYFHPNWCQYPVLLQSVCVCVCVCVCVSI